MCAGVGACTCGVSVRARACACAWRACVRGVYVHGATSVMSSRHRLEWASQLGAIFQDRPRCSGGARCGGGEGRAGWRCEGNTGQCRAVQGSSSARRNFTGSEVVRDEFIGGLENTDQVVFLISVVSGRGACGVRWWNVGWRGVRRGALSVGRWGVGVGRAGREGGVRDVERRAGIGACICMCICRLHVPVQSYGAACLPGASRDAERARHQSKTDGSRRARWPRVVGGGFTWLALALGLGWG